MILSYIYKYAFEFITNLTIISQNRDYIQTHCNDRRNTFHFACHRWYSYKNQGILT